MSPRLDAATRAKIADTRSGRVDATKRTTKPGSETTDMKPGDTVRVGTGVSRRFAGRTGTVAVLNAQTFPDGSTYVEIGTPPDREGCRADAWFRADELAKETR